MLNHIPEQKEKLRKKLERDIERFLESGKKIQKVKTGDSALGDNELSFIKKRLRGAGVDFDEKNH